MGMDTVDRPKELTTARKALTVNLDNEIYGTFAEIGAGQEVARQFFSAGGAAGTVAKSMSAYDMTFSDDIYGRSPRYVSRDRLEKMLAHEYQLLRERLGEARGGNTNFFVCANTAATKSYSGRGECHCWMGLRYQLQPMAEPEDIVVHIRLLDDDAESQREAVGIFGVNMIYAAYFFGAGTDEFMDSLMDNLGPHRVEVEVLQFFGRQGEKVDNRIVALQLVEKGMTNGVFFGPGRGVEVPSELLHKQPVLLERGSFRPVTKTNVDMVDCASKLFEAEPDRQKEGHLTVFEITMKNLVRAGGLHYDDFLARVDTLMALGYTVMISNLPEYYRLSAYFRRYTPNMIGIVLGVNHLLEIFDERYYAHLEGGILEAMGRLFKSNVKLYAYPMRGERFNTYLERHRDESEFLTMESYEPDTVVTVDNLRVGHHLRNLYKYLAENGFIKQVEGYREELLGVYAADAMEQLENGDTGWESFVPEQAAALMKEQGLWGIKG